MFFSFVESLLFQNLFLGEEIVEYRSQTDTLSVDSTQTEIRGNCLWDTSL